MRQEATPAADKSRVYAQAVEKWRQTMSEHRDETSPHEVKVYLAIKSEAGWLTNAEIGKKVPDIAPRTVRAHTLKLTQLGVLDQAEVFPANRYRLAQAKKENAYAIAHHTLRLKQAAEVMGLNW